MPTETEKKLNEMRMEARFRFAEANCRLEGSDPSGHPLYEDIKARMIAGTLSAEDAREEIRKYFTEKQEK